MTDSPTPPNPPAGDAAPPAATPAPTPAKPGSATTLIWRRPDRATLTGALTTVLLAWAITILLHVVYVIQDISYALNDGLQFVGWAFVNLFFYGLWQALFFFGPAFVALWLFLPIVKESGLDIVLKRAAAAGVAGLAGLIVFGLFDGIFDTVGNGFCFGYFGVDLLWGPLANAIWFTVQLLVGATIAWMRATGPAKDAPTPPAATPPAT